MPQQIIVQEDGPILVEDFSTPVRESGKVNGIFKDLKDAELVTGIAKAEIVSMADTKASAKGGHTFSWPTLKEIRAIWAYPVVRQNSGHKAIGVEVTLVAPRTREPVKLYYRSIMSCCRAWDMTPSTIQYIADRSKAWKDSLPPMMASLRLYAKIPQREGTAERDDLPRLFNLRPERGGKLCLEFANRRPIHFDRVQDVPEGLLMHSDWRH